MLSLDGEPSVACKQVYTGVGGDRCTIGVAEKLMPLSEPFFKKRFGIYSDGKGYCHDFISRRVLQDWQHVKVLGDC